MKNRKVCPAVVALGIRMAAGGISPVFAEDQNPPEPPQKEA